MSEVQDHLHLPLWHLTAGAALSAAVGAAGTLLNAAALATLLASHKLKRHPTNDFLVI